MMNPYLAALAGQQEQGPSSFAGNGLPQGVILDRWDRGDAIYGNEPQGGDAGIGSPLHMIARGIDQALKYVAQRRSRKTIQKQMPLDQTGADAEPPDELRRKYRFTPPASQMPLRDEGEQFLEPYFRGADREPADERRKKFKYQPPAMQLPAWQFVPTAPSRYKV